MIEIGRHVYGPVPSRRLGASLGIDLMPPKTCNYDCVYCQLGRTSNRTNRSAPYVKAEDILAELRAGLESGVRPDCITMAGSGEPTLNSELTRVVSRVKEISDLPIVILTNGSLLADPAVSDACLAADLVLPSLDAGDPETFQAVNRPCPEVDFEGMVEGLISFRDKYSGALWLEVMMLEGLNSDDGSVRRIGELVERIGPDEVHLNTVSRPPAEPFARPVPEERLHEVASILQPCTIVLAETMRGEGGAISGSIDKAELLELVRRRPCTRAHVAEAFSVNEIEALKALSDLVAGNRIVSELSEGRVFYRVLTAPSDGSRG